MGSRAYPGLAEIRTRIAEAATRAGRDPGEIKLVAATKMRTPEEIRALLGTGHIDALGENRVQEALPKIAALADIDVPWHFIGRLQTNKAKYLGGRFACVHSLDRPALVDVLARRARDMRVLVQVNVSCEDAKGGVEPERAEDLCIQGLEAGLDIAGLMTMGPRGDCAAARRAFAALRELRSGLEVRLGRFLPDLSMGMTEDFEEAIEEGSTLVRIGRALFGGRRV